MRVAPHIRHRRRASLLSGFVSAHLCESLTLRRVGRALGLGDSTIRRALLACCGLRFHEFVDRVRVSHVAATLLSQPDIKDDALALAAGWRSRTSLHAAVRRVTGHSLRELRVAVISAGASADIPDFLRLLRDQVMLSS
jgi:methylphosphotriester-DNA--protein-cysteine methyltransferase